MQYETMLQIEAMRDDDKEGKPGDPGEEQRIADFRVLVRRAAEYVEKLEQVPESGVEMAFWTKLAELTSEYAEEKMGC